MIRYEEWATAVQHPNPWPDEHLDGAHDGNPQQSCMFCHVEGIPEEVPVS